jgi:hypothetical protein
MRNIDDEILSRVLSWPPVDAAYVAGRWHRDRVAWGGIWVEARVFGKSLITPRNEAVRKFLILGRARSGTTLLTDLLNAHPDVTCELEVLAKRVLAPFKYLERLAGKAPTAAYGAKLLSYQMIQVQQFRDPVRFLDTLHEAGFRLLHLKRETFDQTLSLAIAQSTMRYHQKDAGDKRDPVYLDPDDFLRRLEWSDMLATYEERCLRDLPHLALSYERDLLAPEQQQATADRIFGWIGVRPAAVSSRLKKILPAQPSEVISNYEEIAHRLEKSGLEYLKPGRH